MLIVGTTAIVINYKIANILTSDGGFWKTEYATGKSSKYRKWLTISQFRRTKVIVWRFWDYEATQNAVFPKKKKLLALKLALYLSDKMFDILPCPTVEMRLYSVLDSNHHLKDTFAIDL